MVFPVYFICFLFIYIFIDIDLNNIGIGILVYCLKPFGLHWVSQSWQNVFIFLEIYTFTKKCIKDISKISFDFMFQIFQFL